MSGTPRISFVAGSRNDGHGGNLAHRMQVFVDALLGQCDRHGLDAELVLVEWNPPADRPRLTQSVRWPASERCAVRIVEVPGELHERFDGGLPLHQFIAKNVGIRRARGDFVLATNVDVLFPDEMMQALAEGGLKDGGWYRADRHDVNAEIPDGAGVEEKLAFCAANRLRIHLRDGTSDLSDGTFNRIYRDPRTLRAFRLLAPLGFLPGLGRRMKNARESLNFMENCGRLHTNASGDLTLMARRHWHELRGYWEFAGFPTNIDGLLCFAARFAGLEERMLEPPVYHIEHGQGSGFASYSSGDRWKQLERGGIARIMPEDYMTMVHDMREGRRPLVINGEDWGLGGEDLAEASPEARS